MMNTAIALSSWFEQFGLPVYLDGDVPDEASPPYITIPLKDPDWRSQASFQFSIWYRTTSNFTLLQKADAILKAVGEGARVYFDGGLLVLRIDSDTPTQIMVNDDYRCARISLVLNAYHLPGE